MKPNAIRMHSKDNVAVATSEIKTGKIARIEGLLDLTVNQDIPRGHKLAIGPIAPGEKVLKYGEPIGNAKQAIQPGDHVHVHNLDSGGE